MLVVPNSIPCYRALIAVLTFPLPTLHYSYRDSSPERLRLGTLHPPRCDANASDRSTELQELPLEHLRA